MKVNGIKMDGEKVDEGNKEDRSWRAFGLGVVGKICKCLGFFDLVFHGVTFTFYPNGLDMVNDPVQ